MYLCNKLVTIQKMYNRAFIQDRIRNQRAGTKKQNENKGIYVTSSLQFHVTGLLQFNTDQSENTPRGFLVEK